MQDGEISIMEALNQIQSWLNAGEVEKAFQGCEEILQIEPGNQRAMGLLKQAESQRFKEEKAAPSSAPATAPAAAPVPPVEEKAAPSSAPTPKPEPKAEPKAEPEMEYKMYQAPRPSKKKMFLAMVIPAVLVVVIGGSIVNVLNNNNRDELLSTTDTPTTVNDQVNDVTPDADYLDENEQRVTDLTEMADAIDEFWWDNGFYPGFGEVEDLIKKEIDRLPTDPRQGDEDLDGDPYGYMYALYNFEDGKAGAYILSAVFQDSKGQAHPWAQGASTKNYDNYRMINGFHVIYIGD
ncbi:MAG: hypothetical protein ACI9QC_000588 [Oceanicoccus sp.]|jgi:hypothetical protein